MKDSMEAAAGQLFGVVVDGKMSEILAAALALAGRHPEILAGIAADQEAWGLAKKRQRQEDVAWTAGRTEVLPEWTLPEPQEPTLRLATGRPRLPPLVVYVFVVLRGCFPSLSGAWAWDRLRDSLTLRTFLEGQGCRLPGRTTVLENLQAVSEATLETIWQAQLATALAQGLDDLQELTVDSTAVASASAWPTETHLVEGLLVRAWRWGRALPAFGVTGFRAEPCGRALGELHRAAFVVNVSGARRGKRGPRRRAWRQFLRQAQRLAERLTAESERVAAAVAEAVLKPSRRRRLDTLWASLQGALEQAQTLIEMVAARELGGEQIVRTAEERFYSLSDPDASFIVKGQRETVFGYRPQLGRSRNGLICCLLTPQGNAADAPQLVELVRQHQVNTGVCPRVVSGDDGYSSAAGYRESKELGASVVSLKGAKGKALTPPAEWDSPAGREARRLRSAVESGISVAKAMFGFGQCTRAGLASVRREMLEKVLACNFWRLGYLRETLAPERPHNVRRRLRQRPGATPA